LPSKSFECVTFLQDEMVGKGSRYILSKGMVSPSDASWQKAEAAE